jgi:hypothetical protein
MNQQLFNFCFFKGQKRKIFLFNIFSSWYFWNIARHTDNGSTKRSKLVLEFDRVESRFWVTTLEGLYYT